MNISSRCDYACRAILELARNGHTRTPLTTTAIAERRQIPEKYLPHILLQLKRAGLVKSVRGAQGGYLLAGTADNISLLDVVVAIDGPIFDPPPGEEGGAEDLARAWKRVGESLADVLRNVSIQNVLESGSPSNMYFI